MFERPFADPERIAHVFTGTVRAYYEARGMDLADPAAQSTLATNTVLVRKRGDQVRRLLDELLGVGSLAGKRVLELGSGFGALASYLAWRELPLELIGADVEDDYVRLARDSAAELGLDPILRFEKLDMRNLSSIDDESIDVLIANNSFIYLPTRRDERRALQECARVLVPSGSLLIYQANRWRFNEPFTRDPVVHLLAPSIASVVSRRTGWRHNHGRVRLMSPPELRRELRRAGLQPSGTIGFGARIVRRGPLRNFGTFFAQGGRKP